MPDARGASAGHPARRWLLTGARLLRDHWLVSVLLAAGLALRALALVAYHPAIIYVDTLKYLYGVYPGSEPLGYTALLRLILVAGSLGTVAAIQHLAGLAIAVCLYAVLLRRGAGRWLAALAVAPVLLDAYQIQIEQMIMPDVWFEAMIVAGLAVLLWRPEVTMRSAAVAGLILGSSGLLKQLGMILVLPAVIYLLAAGGGRRLALSASAALVAAFALPVLAYASFSYAHSGHFWLARRQSLTGRLVSSANCPALKLPANVRPLCPDPNAQRRGPDWLEHSGKSPLYATPVAAGTRVHLIEQLDSAIATQQPLRVVAAIARDMLRLFEPSRAPSEWVTPISRWQFQTSYPTFPPWVTLNRSGAIVVGLQGPAFGPFHDHVLKPAYGGHAQVNRPVAQFLRSYQLDGGYTPGPVFALCAIAGLAASALVLLRRMRTAESRQLALASLLFTFTAAIVLLLPDVYEFSWRYEIPAAVTLPQAGVLGILAMLSMRSRARAARSAVSAAAANGEGGTDGGDGDAGGGEHLVGGPGPAAQSRGKPAQE